MLRGGRGSSTAPIMDERDFGMSDVKTAASASPVTHAIPSLEKASRPVPPRKALLVCCVSLALGVGAAIFFAKSRYEKFTGYLQARTLTVTFDREARLSQITVPAGKAVVAGQPLVLVEDTDLNRKILHQQQALQQLEAEVSQTEARMQIELDVQRKGIQKEIFETRLQIAQLLRQRFTTELDEIAALEVSAKFDGLAMVESSTGPANLNLPKPLVLPEDLPADETIRVKLRKQRVVNVKETLTAQIELCEQHLAELNQVDKELPDKIRRSVGLNLVQARLEHARSELASWEQRRQTLIISSPTTGIVGVYNKAAGEHVVPHEPIVQVLDPDRPHVLLPVASNRVADFPVGGVLELRFPGQVKVHGRIESLAPQARPASAAALETQVAVQIVPHGKLWPEIPYGTMIEIRRAK